MTKTNKMTHVLDAFADRDKKQTKVGLLAIPANKEVVYECPIHGTQRYTTYQQWDGSWLAPYCPVCQRVASQEAAYIAEIKAELHERQKTLRNAADIRLPPDYGDATFDNFVCETDEDRRNLNIARRFAERYLIREVERCKLRDAQAKDWKTKNSNGLLMIGNYGTGKTHLCYAIIDTLKRLGVPGFYTTIPDLFMALNDKTSLIDLPVFMRKITMASCVILDEVGVQSGTEYERKVLYQIIDGRLKNGRPTILVTNLDPVELKACLTPRILDRVNVACIPLTFNGKSHRKPANPEGLF